MSIDNVNFNNIPVTTRELTFLTGDAWVPTQTSFYRLVFNSGALSSCVATSTSATVTVLNTPVISQTSGPTSQQIICSGSTITTVSFSITDAVTVTTQGVENTGLAFSGPDANGLFHLTGTPTLSTAVTITAVGSSLCTDTTFRYQIYHVTALVSPVSIMKNGTNSTDTVFQHGGQWYNNTVCQDLVNPHSTDFYPCYALNQSVIPNGDFLFEWDLQPPSAGSIEQYTGKVTWNPVFFGAATVRVRGVDCTTTTAWLSTPIDVIRSTNPGITPTALLTQPR